LIIISIIALFVSRVRWIQPRPDHPIAAASDSSRRRAGVRIIEVAIVTLLDPFVYKAITDLRGRTGVEARVGVAVVAIVASLRPLNDPVAAGTRPAPHTVISVVIVCVVTTFARTDKPVAATSLNAVV
jgi:hypothetical protein